MELITASELLSLLDILFILVVDYVDNGPDSPPDKETAKELHSISRRDVARWGKDLPSLKPSIDAALAGSDKTEPLALLGTEIKDMFDNYRGEQSFTSQELEVLKALGLYLRTDSEAALAKIQKMAGIVRNPFISSRFAPKEVGHQDIEGLRAIVFKLVGRNDTALTLDEAKQVKETHPEEYEVYMQYRREHNQIWKDALVSYIRNSGHETVPYEELLAFLHANGIEHMLPLGFTGEIDDLGRLYTNNGKLIDGVPNATTFPSILMNKMWGKPEGKDFVFQAVRSDGGPGPYFYTLDYKKEASRAKFAKVADLAPKIMSMQKKWFAHVKQFKITDPTSVEATILEILYEFAARVGTPNKPTFGVSTLLVKHASVDPGTGNITLRYLGKDSIKTVHKLMKADPVQKYVIAALMQLLEGKQPKDRIFTVDKGTRKIPVNPSAVNAYWRSLGAEGIGVHKIRTFRGTHLFNELVEKAMEKPPKDERAALELLTKMGEQVGKLLNHIRTLASGGTKVTGTTALQNYVDPTAQIHFFRQLGFRIPKFLEKFDTPQEGDHE
jgi:Eukaryotic DNA topoisomerase I, catalytic core